MKNICSLLVTAFLLNLVWENAHSLLYAHYRGGAITELILMRATLADAVMITLIAVPFLLASRLKSFAWLIIPIGVFIALLIEWYALGTSRWAYNEYMPILPFLGTGLTPTIQLGLLGYLSYRLVEKRHGLASVPSSSKREL